jgi:hypothetical protein
MRKIASDDNYERVNFYDALERVILEASKKLEAPRLEMFKVALRYIQASVDKLDGTLHRSDTQLSQPERTFIDEHMRLTHTDQFDHEAHPYVRPKWPSEPSTVL